MIAGSRRNGAAAATALLACVLFLAWSPAMADAPPALDGAAVAWSRLVFRAADRPDDLAVEVKLADIAPGGLAALLGAGSGEAPPRPADATAMRMTSTIDVRLTGQTYRTDIWFYPAGVVPLQRLRDKIGDDPSRKTYRYLSDGVRRLRLDPDTSAEAQLPPDRWSRVKETFYPFGAARAGCPVVTEPNLLLLIASAGAVSRPDKPLDLCVFNKESVYRVRLTAAPGETMEASYLESRGGDRTKVRRRAAVRTVRIDAVAPEANPAGIEPFEFFEMGGTIEIDLDAETGLPLRISGEVTGLGRVAFTLSEADLRS